MSPDPTKRPAFGISVRAGGRFLDPRGLGSHIDPYTVESMAHIRHLTEGLYVSTDEEEFASIEYLNRAGLCR